MERNAVLLAGFMRDYNKTIEDYKKNIIGENDNVDLFIVTWDKIGLKIMETKKITLTNGNQKEITTKDTNDEKINEDDIIKKYEPTCFKVFDLDLFEESIISYAKLAEYSNLINTNAVSGKSQCYLTVMRRYSCFFILNQGMKLIENYSKKNNIQYTKILKIRADFERGGYYPKINWNINMISNKIFISNWNKQSFTINKRKKILDDFSDHLAFGNYEDMKIYLTIFENLYKIENKFVIDGKRFKSMEYCLAVWLTMNNIRYKPISKYCLLS